MPVEAITPVRGRQVRPAIAATPPRLRPKGPVGPDFYRQSPTAVKARPKQSAVERLEADKAKYVKSQVALTKQQPIRPAEMRRPVSPQSAPVKPTRKPPARPASKHGGVMLDLEHLSNLINGVNDGPVSMVTDSSEGSQPSTAAGIDGSPAQSSDPGAQELAEEKPCPAPTALSPEPSSPAEGRLKTSGPSKAEVVGSVGAPAAVTIRRVDVVPQTRPARTTSRPLQYMRLPLHPVPLQTQFPLHQATSNLRLFYSRTMPGPPPPLKPVAAPPPPHDHPPSCLVNTNASASLSPPVQLLSPPSPATTRLSSSSSRKRPSLTRSKSDMSDRCSRAGTELERFFNLCGLDPSDLQQLATPGSDIVSLTRLRSASAPGSECAGSGREDGDEEVTERSPYGVSVIERNARVIKWLYGIRQAKDNAKTTNL